MTVVVTGQRDGCHSQVFWSSLSLQSTRWWTAGSSEGETRDRPGPAHHTKAVTVRYLCFIWLCVDVWTCTSSILHLVIISMDRYIAVTHPVTYPNIMTGKRFGNILFIILKYHLNGERKYKYKDKSVLVIFPFVRKLFSNLEIFLLFIFLLWAGILALKESWIRKDE